MTKPAKTRKAKTPATPTHLEPGTYRLTQDVRNPKKPDHRRNAWYEATTFEKGWAFSVKEANEALELPAMLRKQGTNESVRNNEPAWEALAPYLEPVVEQPSDWLDRTGRSLASPLILNELLRNHGITMAQLQKASEMVTAIGIVAYLCESFEGHILARGMDEHNAYRVLFGRSLDASKVVLWVSVHPDVKTFRIVQQGTAAAVAEEPAIHAASVEFLAQLAKKGYRKVP